MNNRTIIILGMHRSGTSALAGSLEQAGVYLGDVNRSSPDNVKGNRESLRIMTLQEDILQRNGGSWDKPVNAAQWQRIHFAMRDCVIECHETRPVWGFKDPRTLLVLQGWLKALPNAELVGIFRHPFLVAESLYVRNKITHENGLNLWLEYNRILHWYLNRHNCFSLIEFCHENNKFQVQIEKLVTSLGLAENSLSFFDSTLKQSVIPDLSSESNAKSAINLYRNLQSLRTFE